MVGRLRRGLGRAEAWLESRGLRRTVLLAVGCAGLATALTAGVALDELNGLADRGATTQQAVARTVGDAERLHALVWQARWAALDRSTAGTAGERAASGRRFDVAVREVRDTVADYRRQPLTAAQDDAMTAFDRTWRGYLQAHTSRAARAGSAERAAADAVARAVATLNATTQTAAADHEQSFEGAALRSRVVAVLLLGGGLIGAVGLVRLFVGFVAQQARRALDAVAGLLREPAPTPPVGTLGTAVGPLPGGAGGAVGAAGADRSVPPVLSVAAATELTELMRVTVDRLEATQRSLVATGATVTAAAPGSATVPVAAPGSTAAAGGGAGAASGSGAGWWLRSVPPAG